jgi:transposase
VAIGVDTHKDVHVGVALDGLGAQLDSREIATTPAGYRSLLSWAQELGVPAFAIEGTGSYGAGLVRCLERAGLSVYECERPRRRERRRGKSDLIDAALAARRLLAGEGLSLPRGGGRREDLRLLLLERRSAMRARTAALNQLHALLVTAPDPVRERLGALSGERLAHAAVRLRPRDPDVLTGVLRRLGQRVERLSSEVAEAERRLAALLAEVAPDLLEECGVGPVCGAQLLVSSGDPDRLRSEASFAALAGTSPVDASSGNDATGSTAAATDSSTGLCTSSPSRGSATTPRPAPTTSSCSPPARRPRKPAAASSERSPATSTDAFTRCRCSP